METIQALTDIKDIYYSNFEPFEQSEPLFGVEDIKLRLKYDNIHESEDILSESATNYYIHKTPEHLIPPPTSYLKGNFKLLQSWEGRVLNVDSVNHEFTAIVTDKTDPSANDEQITLSIDEIPPDDLSLLVAGATFYWSIGYADYPGRPRSRESRIRLRRLPKWTQAELTRMEDRGKQLADFFASHCEFETTTR